MSEFYTARENLALLPAIILALFGCWILVFDFLFVSPKQKRYFALVVVMGLIFAGSGLYKQQAYLAESGNLVAFGGALTIDRFALYFNWVFTLATLIVAIVSYNYLEIEGEHHGEYYALLLFAQCGMFFLAAGTDLVTLFIGLELMALCFYVMVGFLRRRQALERGRHEISCFWARFRAGFWSTASRSCTGSPDRRTSRS